jgi:hypothetical protein
VRRGCGSRLETFQKSRNALRMPLAPPVGGDAALVEGLGDARQGRDTGPMQLRDAGVRSDPLAFALACRTSTLLVQSVWLGL